MRRLLAAAFASALLFSSGCIASPEAASPEAAAGIPPAGTILNTTLPPGAYAWRVTPGRETFTAQAWTDKSPPDAAANPTSIAGLMLFFDGPASRTYVFAHGGETGTWLVVDNDEKDVPGISTSGRQGGFGFTEISVDPRVMSPDAPLAPMVLVAIYARGDEVNRTFNFTFVGSDTLFEPIATGPARTIPRSTWTRTVDARIGPPDLAPEAVYDASATWSTETGSIVGWFSGGWPDARFQAEDHELVLNGVSQRATTARLEPLAGPTLSREIHPYAEVLTAPPGDWLARIHTRVSTSPVKDNLWYADIDILPYLNKSA